MSLEDDLHFLGAVPYFRGLPIEDLARIRTHCHRRHLDIGEIIMLEGQPAEALYVVCSGAVRIFKTSDDGRREQVLLVAGPGETFNEAPVFDGGPNPASAQATTPGAGVCVVPAPYLTHLLAADPRVSANAIRVLAARLRHLITLVEDLSFRHVTMRVAKLLYDESQHTDIVTLSQQEMAARVGTTREGASRALRDLEQRGLITRGPRHAVRVDRSGVRAILDRAPA